MELVVVLVGPLGDGLAESPQDVRQVLLVSSHIPLGLLLEEDLDHLQLDDGLEADVEVFEGDGFFGRFGENPRVHEDLAGVDLVAVVYDPAGHPGRLGDG